MDVELFEAVCDECGLPADDFIAGAGVLICVECGCKRELGTYDALPTRAALEAAKHDIATCDCGGCENVRRAEATH